MNFLISGRVIKGDGYGRKLGFPTVNLEIKNKNQKIPKVGVYAGFAILESKTYRAGIVIGLGDKVEAHLIGYNEDAYGKEVTLELHKFLRDYRKFNTEEELIIQIKEDISLC